jgi:DNA-binding LytR/AlgR family response regulator
MKVQSPSKAGECIPVKSGRKVILLKVSDIDWIGAAHNYVTLHVEKQSHLRRGTLNSIRTTGVAWKRSATHDNPRSQVSST